jgi:SAM-dependent methyltransferase
MTEVIPAAAFDGLAERYDAQFTATALGAVLRKMSWRRFERAFAGREYLLDIGCGTGEDAIHFAKLGHRVVATDASLQMVRLATRKAELAGCARDIQFVWAPMERLGAELAGETFDGMYSNFGAINCAPDLVTLPRDIAPLMRPGAPLAWVVMGRYVPWEWAWYLARGDAHTAFRRMRAGGVAWRGLQVSYPTPATLARLVQPYFVPRTVTPLGLLLPGSYAAPLFERVPRVLAALARAEHSLQRWHVGGAFADHYCFEARRQFV